MRWPCSGSRSWNESGSLDPESDPVQAAGHPNVESLLAELWKTSLPAARQLCGVARATAPRHTLQGDELPAEFPDLAQALLGPSTASERGGDPDCSDAVSADATGADATGATGADPDDAAGDAAGDLRPRVSVEQAGAIIRELVKTGPGCSLEDRAMGERVLIEHAPGLTVEQLRKLAVQVRERLDQDGTEPREQAQRRLRSLTISTTRDGMIHINWYLDAESAGHVLPQLTAYVSQDYRANHDQPGSGAATTASDVAPTVGVRFQLSTPDRSSRRGADRSAERTLPKLSADNPDTDGRPACRRSCRSHAAWRRCGRMGRSTPSATWPAAVHRRPGHR